MEDPKEFDIRTLAGEIAAGLVANPAIAKLRRDGSVIGYGAKIAEEAVGLARAIIAEAKKPPKTPIKLTNARLSFTSIDKPLKAEEPIDSTANLEAIVRRGSARLDPNKPETMGFVHDVDYKVQRVVSTFDQLAANGKAKSSSLEFEGLIGLFHPDWFVPSPPELKYSGTFVIDDINVKNMEMFFGNPAPESDFFAQSFAKNYGKTCKDRLRSVFDSIETGVRVDESEVINRPAVEATILNLKTELEGYKREAERDANYIAKLKQEKDELQAAYDSQRTSLEFNKGIISEMKRERASVLAMLSKA